MSPTYGGKAVKQALYAKAEKAAGQRLTNLEHNRELLTKSYERGYHVAQMLETEGWQHVEAVIFRKHLGLDKLVQAASGESKEVLLGASQRYAVVQGILDDIYTLVATSKRAKEMLDELESTKTPKE